MATRLQAIEAEIMKLDSKSRAKLAERLILSLGSPMDPDLEQVWIEEAGRRVEEIRKGRVRTRPAAAVLRRVRRQVSRKRSLSTR